MISVKNVKYKDFSFSAGEYQFKILEVESGGVIEIDLRYESDAELVRIMLINNAIRAYLELKGLSKRVVLNIPYIPYGRQDRICHEGEAFSLEVIAGLINMCCFDEVLTLDTHSVVSYSINNLVDMALDYGSARRKTCVIAPDAGAGIRAKNFAEANSIPDVFILDKQRCSKTGHLLYKDISEKLLESINSYENIIVVDDICDGGKTFIELAKLIKRKDLTLRVSHGIFSKGKKELELYYKNIIVLNNMERGVA